MKRLPTYRELKGALKDEAHDTIDKTISRLAMDIDAVDSDTLMRDATAAARTPRGGTDAPLVLLGQGEYRREWPSRAVSSSIPNRAASPIWDTVAKLLPKDGVFDHEIEVSIEYRYEKGERRTYEDPGERPHVTAFAAFLPPAMVREILRNLTHELATSAFKVHSTGLLTEESIHDFVRNAGANIVNIIGAVQADADDTASEEENPDQFDRRASG